MGIEFITNLTKRAILELSERRFAATSAVWTQQQCKAYARSPHNPRKIRVYETPRTFYKSYPHRPYSSTPSPSSSNQKTGFLAWYLGMLESRPIITKSISSATIYAAADLTSQTITMPSFGSFDLMRTLRMAGFGLIILGPVQHIWFNFLARVLPKRDLAATLKKLIAGQLTYGPFITAIFFSFNAALQGESSIEIAARLKRDLIPTIMSGLMYWPVCDFLTYKIIPVHLQPLANSSFSYLWTIYLTYMASLKKAVAD